MKTYRSLYWIIPSVFFLLTVLLSGYIDMPIANYFYQLDSSHFAPNAFAKFIYKWGVFPGQVVGIAAIVCYLLSYTKKAWKTWRKPALMLILTMSIGAGFIAHVALKDRWGRPRPKQVVEFGGEQEFRAIYQPNFFNQPQPSKSFPSGHSAMGFFFFSFIFLGRRLQMSWLIVAGFFLSITLGIALSYTRMAMGGHFFTDTLTSAILMWLTAYLCDWMLYGEE